MDRGRRRPRRPRPAPPAVRQPPRRAAPQARRGVRLPRGVRPHRGSRGGRRRPPRRRPDVPRAVHRRTERPGAAAVLHAARRRTALGEAERIRRALYAAPGTPHVPYRALAETLDALARTISTGKHHGPAERARTELATWQGSLAAVLRSRLAEAERLCAPSPRHPAATARPPSRTTPSATRRSPRCAPPRGWSAVAFADCGPASTPA
ncbi:hypothetical protein ACWV95_19840 [Streptomyces albus]